MNKFDFIDYSTITNNDSCGITISNKDIDMTTGKIIINGVEITDTKSWEKAISTLEEKDKEIEQLKEERKTLYSYTPEKGFELVGDNE